MSEPTDKYREAGVDIKAADTFIEKLKKLTTSTARPGADGALGGFGAIFDLKAAGFDDPLLVAGTDGVGTKVQLAAASDRNRGVGIDLVAMCVNDLVVQGAEPLFFLDYMATSKLLPDQLLDVAAGIADGCRQAGCALIGGETAEMPGIYKPKEYDLAGFCVGAVERSKLITGDKVKPDDVLIGLESSGPHANGFSLIRKIVHDSSADTTGPARWNAKQTLGEALLEPTRIYVKPLLTLMQTIDVHAMAHITGGGFTENIPRVLPDTLAATVDASSWELPGVFNWLQDKGDLSVRDMARTFNCGIGMVVVVSAEDADETLSILTESGVAAHKIGEVTNKTADWQCRVTGPSGLWGQWSDWNVTDKD